MEKGLCVNRRAVHKQMLRLRELASEGQCWTSGRQNDKRFCDGANNLFCWLKVRQEGRGEDV